MMITPIMRAMILVKGKIDTVFVLAIATVFMQIPSFYGEDIVNARNNYLTGNRTDFWGGVSTLIYAHIPNFGFRWQIWLAIFQITLTAFGLKSLITIRQQNRKIYLMNCLLAYSALVFGSQMTRDGLMFSLLLFGFARLKRITTKDSSTRAVILPLIVICIAMSFRPWLSIAVIPIVLFLLRNSKIKMTKTVLLLLLISISVTPVLFELASAKSLGLKKSYPEQQVMLMDTAATYCYTTNYLTGLKARKALEIFTSNPIYPKMACQLYRPDTWLSLTQSRNASSEGVEVNFALIPTGDYINYQSLKSKWINLIISDPVTYLQNKMLFANKLLIGSDSRNISLLSAKTNSTKLLGFFRLPFDIAISLHAYSFLAFFVILLLLPLKRYFRDRSIGLALDQLTIALFTATVLWISLSSVAYIGSNGRYTYALTLLSLVIYSSQLTSKSASEEKNG